MIKRGFWILVFSLFFIPLVSAQWLMPFTDFINVMVENGFFTFLFFFGLFFAAASASLSRVFPRGNATMIALFLSFLLTAAGMYTGYLNLQMLGPWSLILFIVIILLAFLFFFVMGRERAPNYKIILLIAFAAGILILSLFNLSNIVWNYLFAITMIVGLIGLLVLARNLGGGVRFPPGREGGRDDEGERGRRRERELEPAGPLSVRIIDPSDGSEYRVGDRIPFKAEIRGGRAPYFSNIIVGNQMRYSKLKSNNIVFVPNGIPTVGLPEGPTIVEIDTIDSGGKRLWYTLGFKKSRGNFASDTVRVMLHGASHELKADIIQPRGEVNGEEKISLIGAVQGGKPGYYATRLFVNRSPIPGVKFQIPNEGTFKHDLGKTYLELGMQEGNKYTIQLEILDSEGARAIADTEINVKGEKPGKDLSVRITSPYPNQRFEKKDKSGKELQGFPFIAEIDGGKPPYYWVLLLNGGEVWAEKAGDMNKKLEFNILINRVKGLLARGKDGKEHAFVIEVRDSNGKEAEDSKRFFYEIEEVPPPGKLAVKITEPAKARWTEEEAEKGVPFRAEITGDAPFVVDVTIDDIRLPRASSRNYKDNIIEYALTLKELVKGLKTFKYEEKAVGKHAFVIRVQKDGMTAEDAREFEIVGGGKPIPLKEIKELRERLGDAAEVLGNSAVSFRWKVHTLLSHSGINVIRNRGFIKIKKEILTLQREGRNLRYAYSKEGSDAPLFDSVIGITNTIDAIEKDVERINHKAKIMARRGTRVRIVPINTEGLKDIRVAIATDVGEMLNLLKKIQVITGIPKEKISMLELSKRIKEK